MADIQRHRICLDNITQGGLACSNPTITWTAPECITVPCIEDNCIEVEVIPGCGDPCITVTIDCEDCEKCPPEVRVICFCADSDDCTGGCEFCDQGICKSLCAEGKLCEDNTCVDCLTAAECLCDQICVQGTCQCPQDKPLKRADGCCVECLSSNDCGPCDVCIDGVCVPKTCPSGNCNPFSGECVDCWDNSQCTQPNECCQPDGSCDCCSGYFRDPLSGLCTKIPICFIHNDCPPCFDCVGGVCVPKVCPEGKICVDGECEPGCTGPYDCPPPQGCLDGVCVDCATISCDGVLSPCTRALGCDCNGGVCEGVDCSNNDCVEWIAVPAEFVPGDSTIDPGMPALVFSTAFTDLGVVQMGGGDGAFRDYSITVSTSGGESGTWEVEGGYTTNSSSIVFTLSAPGAVQWNNVGFEVTFVESGGTGRTGSIVIYNQNWFAPDPASPDTSLFEGLMTDPANWIVDVQANSITPGTSNGTTIPGSIKLCACNAYSDITSFNWTTIEGNLTVVLYPTAGAQCATASIQGCGTGEGTVTLDCAGSKTTIPIPELPFDYSAATCCDPIADPTCLGDGGGDSCVDLSVVSTSIVLSESNYTDGNDGVFLGVLQETPSLGLTVPVMLRTNRDFCWSATGDMSLYSGDAIYVPAVLKNLFQHVTFGGGSGCVRMGYDCEVVFDGCQKLQAEACLDACTPFSTYIQGDTNPGDTLTAVTSFGGASLSFVWTTDDPTFVTPVGNTLVIPDPNLNISTITVTATVNINGETCTDSYTITIDKTSIPDIQAPTYDCASGFVFNDSGGVTYRDDLGNTLNAGDRVAEQLAFQVLADLGPIITTYTVDIPACYGCPSCIQAISGVYDSVVACNTGCVNCDQIFDVDVAFTCENQAAKVIMTVNQGVGPYTYSVTSNGNAIDSGSFTGTSKVITNIPQGDITVNVADSTNGCDLDESQTVSGCVTCVPNDGTVTISSVDSSDVCNGLVSLQVASTTPSPFPIIVEILLGTTPIYTETLTSGVSVSFSGLSLANRSYLLTATDANGCSAFEQLVVDCQSVVCSQYGVVYTTFSPQVDGGDVDISVDWTSTIALPIGSTLKLEKLINPSGCSGGGIYLVVGTEVVVAGLTSGIHTFIDSGASGTTACYRATITYQPNVGGEICTTIVSQTHEGATSLAQNCSICLAAPANPCNDVTWVNDELTINWCFTDPPLTFTIDITDPQSLTTFADGSTTLLVTSSTFDSTGSLVLSSPATGTARNVTVEFSTGQAACDYTCITNIPACTCAINSPGINPILSYSEPNQELLVEFDAVCGSGDYLITVNIYGDGVCGGAPTSTPTQVISAAVGDSTGNIAIFPLIQGTTQSVTVLIEDNADGTCNRSVVCFVIPGCDICTTQNVGGIGSRIQTFADSDSNSYSFNGSGFTECALQATGILTLTGNAGNTEVVVIGGTTYTFLTVFVDVGTNVKIGAAASDSIDNLISAITGVATGAAVVGVDFPTGVVVNTDVTAAQGVGDTMDVTFIDYGSSPAIATTTTLVSGSWGAATLANGNVVNDSAASDMQTQLNAIDTCGSAVVRWSEVSGLTPDECLTYEETFAGAGSNTIQVVSFTFAGPTVYTLNTTVAIYTAGTPALITGAAQTIATALGGALDTEGVAYSSVRVDLSISGTDIVIGWKITGVLNTTSIDTIAGIVGAETTVAENTSCTDPAVSSEKGFDTPANGCITFTITGSGIQLSTMTYVSGEVIIVDTTSC